MSADAAEVLTHLEDGVLTLTLNRCGTQKRPDRGDVPHAG